MTEGEIKKHYTESNKNNENSINEDYENNNKRTDNFQNEVSNNGQLNENQILIGACIGAGVIITVLIFIFIGYRLYVKRRHNKSKKHRSTIVGPSGVQSQVTLLPIRGVPIRGDNRGVARLPSNMTSSFVRLPSNKNFMTSPPPYHESFLDNRNSFRNIPG